MKNSNNIASAEYIEMVLWLLAAVIIGFAGGYSYAWLTVKPAVIVTPTFPIKQVEV